MNIYIYSNYSTFLRNYIKGLPKNGRGEINRIAENLRVHPTLVSQVLGGSKDFSLEQAHILSKYLGLNSMESDYFLLLVQKARAGTTDLKNYFSGNMQSGAF